MQLQLEPLIDGGRRVGAARSRTYEFVREGLLPPAIKVGKNSFLPSYEIDEIVSARIAGKGDDEIKKLVADLVARRASLASQVTK